MRKRAFIALCLNIKYSHRYPKRHFLTRNDVVWRILRKNLFKGVGCSLIEEPPKNERKTSHIDRHGKITYLGSRNPWTDRYKIFHAVCHPGSNHICQFWWRSVKGVLAWRGDEFWPFPLTCFVAFKTHYRASVFWKQRMRKNTRVHIDGNTFACKHQRLTVLTQRIQKEAKIN